MIKLTFNITSTTKGTPNTSSNYRAAEIGWTPFLVMFQIRKLGQINVTLEYTSTLGRSKVSIFSLSALSLDSRLRMNFLRLWWLSKRTFCSYTRINERRWRVLELTSEAIVDIMCWEMACVLRAARRPLRVIKKVVASMSALLHGKWWRNSHHMTFSWLSHEESTSEVSNSLQL